MFWKFIRLSRAIKTSKKILMLPLNSPRGLVKVRSSKRSRAVSEPRPSRSFRVITSNANSKLAALPIQKHICNNVKKNKQYLLVDVVNHMKLWMWLEDIHCLFLLGLHQWWHCAGSPVEHDFVWLIDISH
jgi:hypothetical protein